MYQLKKGSPRTSVDQTASLSKNEYYCRSIAVVEKNSTKPPFHNI